MELLRCEKITKIYGNKDNQVVAINKVDLKIKEGEFVVILGASGSGKSTMLHMIGAIDTLTDGKIYVGEHDISSLNSTEAAIFRRRKVGLVYQFYNLIPTLTVEQNIKLPMRLDKRKPEQIFFDEIIKTLGLTCKLNSLPHQLSGGEQQRTAIARALLYRPALLLADEPTGNLDAKNSREVINLLKVSNQTMHQTILLTTHDERIAAEAQRIIIMEDGIIISDKRRAG